MKKKIRFLNYSQKIVSDKFYTFFEIADIDECLEIKNSCPNPESLCLNTVGSFDCINSREVNQEFVTLKNQQEINSQNEIICTHGYKPSSIIGDSCIDIDECRENIHSCETNEKCINELGTYRCESFLEISTVKINTELEKQNEIISKNETKVLKSKDDDICLPGFSFNNETKKCEGKINNI